MKATWVKLLIVSISLSVGLVVCEVLLRFVHAPGVLSEYMKMQGLRGGTDRDWRFDRERYSFEPDQTFDVLACPAKLEPASELAFFEGYGRQDEAETIQRRADYRDSEGG